MKLSLFFIVLIVAGCNAIHVTSHQKVIISNEKAVEYDSLFSSALKLKVFGSYSQADNLLHKCLIINPKAAAVYYELSLVYAAQNRKTAAISAGLKAVKFDGTNEWYMLQLSNLYKVAGKIDSSLYYYERVVKVKPEKYEYGIKLAQLYFDNHNYKRSLGVLKKVERKQGSTTDIFFNRYKNYLALSKNKKCIETLKAAVKKYPYELRFYGLLAEHYASIGKAGPALAYYKQLLKIDAGNERTHLSLIDFYRSYGYRSEAMTVSKEFIRNGEFNFNSKVEVVAASINDQESFSLFKTDVKGLVDSMFVYYPNNAKCYSLLADYLVKDNMLKEAQLELEKDIQSFKDDASLFEQLLYVLNLRNDFRGLYESSVLGMLNFKSNPMMYLYGGIAGLRLRKYTEAIEMLSAGLKFTEDSKALMLKYYMYLGECYNAIKDYEKSDLFFESALGIDGSDPLILNNYSYYLAYRRERLDRALLYINRCREMDPRNYLFMDTYAWVLFRMGNLVEARKAIENCLSNGGDKKPVILEHYCEILMSLDLKDEAIRYYHKLKKSGINAEGMRVILNIND